jgi:hypothetical protein
MSRYALKFPRRVRIHGGEFDESARAIHREDGLKTIQAESGIVLGSTIERKQMSTKTTFKRVALVAVAALGFGVMSVAPSSAAIGQADTLTAASATASVLTNATASVVVTSSFVGDANDTTSATVSLVSGPATNGVLPTIALTGAGDTNLKNTSATVGRTTTFVANANGLVVGNATVSLTPVVAGTYVVRITPHTGSGAAALTWTVTAAAPNTTLNADKSTAVRMAGEVAAGTEVAVTASKNLSDTATAVIYVTPKNSDDVALSSVVGTTVPLTVTVSGPGTVAIGTNLAAITALSAGAGRAVTGTTGHYVIGVFADGTAGVSTITISSGTTVITSRTVTFYGVETKITPTIVKSVLSRGANAGAITAIVTDAAGVPVYNQAVWSLSDTDANVDIAPVSCGSSTAAGLVTCDITGDAAGAGSATISLMNASTLAASTVTAVAGSVRVSDGTPTAVAFSFDKATYAPGEAAKVSATVSNAAGPMPEGTYAVLTGALSSNYALTLPAGVTLPSGNVTVGVNGAATTTSVVMPTGISGTVQLAATAAATTIAVTVGSADVVNEALDAALEAIDAAENARLASEAAIEAATDAQAAAEDAITAAENAQTAAEDAGAAAVQAGLDAVAAADAAGAAAIAAVAEAVAATEEASAAAVAAAEKAGADAIEAAEQAGRDAVEATDLAVAAADAATAAADLAAEAATEAGEMAVAAAEAAGLIAQDALDAAIEATAAATDALDAANEAKASADAAKASADAATAAVEALSTKVATLMAGINAKINSLSTLLAKIAKKVGVK